jgi:hypothetical protein
VTLQRLVLYGALIALIVHTPRSLLCFLFVVGLSPPPWLMAGLPVVAVVPLALCVFALDTALIPGEKL